MISMVSFSLPPPKAGLIEFPALREGIGIGATGAIGEKEGSIIWLIACK
jgi:hypothetical protein